MTLFDREPAAAASPNHRAKHAAGISPGASFSLVALPTAVGALLLALAFRAGREGDGVVDYYWLGQVLLFAPASIRLVFFECGRREAEYVAVLVGVTSYAVKIAYSPTGFRFPDELQHWRTLTDLMATGNLRTANPALPISPHFPGLELATAAVSQLTGASTFVAGAIVVGIAHVLTLALLVAFFGTITGSPRLAGLSAVVYAANPHFQNFDAMFLYQALAIALLVACLAATARAVVDEAHSGQWLAVAIVAGVATVVTHHISSFVLAFFLVVGLFDRSVTRDWIGFRRIAIAFGVVAAATMIWITTVAADTTSYFAPVADQLLNNVTGLFGEGGKGGAAAPATGSRLDHLVAYASVLLLVGGLIVGWWALRRSNIRGPWVRGLAISAATFLIALAVRVLAADGAELYGRAMSFVFIPLSLIVSIAVLWVAAYVRPAFGRAIIALLLVVVFIGGIMTGWPPAWERVPGRYLVSGYESSVEPIGIAAARWAGRRLPPGSNVAADLTNYTLFGTYGRLNAIRQVAPLYYGDAITPADRRLISDLSIRYVVSDLRLAQQPPASGSYFPQTVSGSEAGRLSAADLRKFDGLAGASRIYDGGAIVIYDVAGTHRG